ncbi:winged helix-turn-helix domain-containing protein [Arthrobacter castelli]|uniref:winged helix-turn-helix domain-containing protein n=1 Tax=Arthrobacter castelli TaxID=271431 RepID=UPI0004793CC4|nr:crosslink repair DNA glycosylase YcaQ family protein [Arthrobacter castelli]
MNAALTLDQARRIALSAQGLASARPTSLVTARQVGRTFDRLQLIQIDSVNVLVRSHYLPLFSRLGDYDVDIVHRMAGRAPRRMVEYWAHEASYIRPQHFEDLRLWQKRAWVGAHGMETAERLELARRILAVLESSRPLTARQVSARLGHDDAGPKTNWGWNWNAAKRVLEHLFELGEVSAAGRTAQFERLYSPAGKVLPAQCTEKPAPDPDQAMLRLIEAAASAHGIGTIRCFADYFRVGVRPATAAVEELVRQRILEPVTVTGWDRHVFRHAEAKLPRKATGRALLSPFDSLVFERRRLQELFNFHYRIEIYTPAPKRRYGYYVLPFLLRDRLVARVDLKADRNGGKLLVRGSFAERDAPADTAVELADELRAMAAWLGMDDVVVEQRGDLAASLAAAVGPNVIRRQGTLDAAHT